MFQCACGFLRRGDAWIVVPLLIGCSVALASSSAVFQVGNFSAARAGETLPDGWTPLTFKKIERHTVYSLIEDEGRVVVLAVMRPLAAIMPQG